MPSERRTFPKSEVNLVSRSRLSNPAWWRDTDRDYRRPQGHDDLAMALCLVSGVGVSCRDGSETSFRQVRFRGLGSSAACQRHWRNRPDGSEPTASQGDARTGSMKRTGPSSCP